jgi:formiminotetrahydrofolate cyclodeaminase
MSDTTAGGIGGQTIEGFLAALGSDAATPGGGAAAALAGATGAALVAMVGRLTIGRPGMEEVESRMAAAIERADAAVKRFLTLADDDTAAFDAVMRAFRLPKENDDEWATRSDAIQASYRGAAEAPLDVARLAAGLMEVADDVTGAGNRNAASDGLSAAALLHAAVVCACANVEINAAGLRDESARAAYLEEIEDLRRRAAHSLQDTDAVFRLRLSS